MINFLLIAIIVMVITAVAGIASAAMPSGFASTTIVVDAQITAMCQEASHVLFPNPITIDTLAGSDETFSPTVDETLKCSRDAIFTVKVSSTNETVVGQACISSGVAAWCLDPQ